jgi:hypothetical protein
LQRLQAAQPLTDSVSKRDRLKSPSRRSTVVTRINSVGIVTKMKNTLVKPSPSGAFAEPAGFRFRIQPVQQHCPILPSKTPGKQAAEFLLQLLEAAPEGLEGLIARGIHLLKMESIKLFGKERLSFLRRVSQAVEKALDGPQASYFMELLVDDNSESSFVTQLQEMFQEKIALELENVPKVQSILSFIDLMHKLPSMDQNKLKDYIAGWLRQNKDKTVKVSQIFNSKTKHLKMLILAHSLTEGMLPGQAVEDILHVCLRAVSAFFQRKKSLSHTSLYLRLALRCLAISKETCSNSRTPLDEFVIYFLMNCFDKTSGLRNVPRIVTTFLTMIR